MKRPAGIRPAMARGPRRCARCAKLGLSVRHIAPADCVAEWHDRGFRAGIEAAAKAVRPSATASAEAAMVLDLARQFIEALRPDAEGG